MSNSFHIYSAFKIVASPRRRINIILLLFALYGLAIDRCFELCLKPVLSLSYDVDFDSIAIVIDYPASSS
jgi:hypothetical protein